MHYLISIVSLYNNFYSLCGAKGFRDFGLFHIKPKTHAEEEEVPEDERRESRLSGLQTEITEGKDATSPEVVPSRIPKEIPNLMGQP